MNMNYKSYSNARSPGRHKGFMTETGYITRTGLTRLRAGMMPMIYPKSELILRIDPVAHIFQIRDKFSGLYETDNSFDLRFILPRNSTIILGGQICVRGLSR